ncbi:shikimate kinase [Paenibacillus sp. Marseille-Q4541]|uniref:shikimate kinase n=1 Tax=Paenibacillus sp. Marseille-Q4541 TaxID=2831522 RepID=UPI001BA459D6|nr:shikimate kinase [Paenibacillus sp. Marseille-Q4541]
MKIRIVGSCGSGKSTLARKLSREYGIPYFEIDNMIWNREYEGVRYSQAERDERFKDTLEMKTWIMEGVQFDWTTESFEQADVILILNPSVIIRDYRIVKRFVLSRTGFQQWNYKQSVKNLCKMMIEWNHGYDVAKVIEVTNPYANKRRIIKRSDEALDYINSLKSLRMNLLLEFR